MKIYERVPFIVDESGSSFGYGFRQQARAFRFDSFGERRSEPDED